MHTQHIILAATTLAALLILITTAYLAGRKDRKNAQQQAVDEALYLCRVSHGQELTALHTDLIKLRTNAQRLQQVIDIRTASRLLSGHARQFQKTGTTKRNADAEAQQQLAAILQRLAITELASQSAEAEAQEAA